LRQAGVRGSIPATTDLSSRRCAAGHEIVLRRVARPPSLPYYDDRQLALT
jgi:hypothetical protein